MSWILYFVEFCWLESGLDYHIRVELWVEPSVLLSAFGNRGLNRYWELNINDLNWIESTWILVNPSELWIMKEVDEHITAEWVYEESRNYFQSLKSSRQSKISITPIFHSLYWYVKRHQTYFFTAVPGSFNITIA